MKNVAPSYPRGRDETSRTGPNTPLEPAQPGFVCSALNETKKLERDEFCRLQVIYPTAFPRYTRRSGCGNGRNTRNTAPSTSTRISSIARRRSTSTTITTSSRRCMHCCRRIKIGNTRCRRSTSTTITSSSSTRGRRRSTSSRSEPILSEISERVEMEKRRKHEHTDSSFSTGFLLCTHHNTFTAIFVM